MAQTIRQDPVAENVDRMIQQQKLQVSTANTDLLDSITSKYVNNLIFKTEEKLQGSGLYSIIFPIDYSQQELDTKKNVACCHHHQVEFLIQGSVDTVIEGKFNFLQPEIQQPKLRQVRTGNKNPGLYPYNELDIGGTLYTKCVSDSYARQVSETFTVGQASGSLQKKPFDFNEQVSQQDFWEHGTQQSPDEKPLHQIAKTVSKIYGSFNFCSAPTRIPGVYRVTVIVENFTPLKAKNDIKKEAGLLHSFFGSQIELEVKSGKIVPLDFVMKDILPDFDKKNQSEQETITGLMQLEVRGCANLNTVAKISTEDASRVFASPVAIFDYKRINPDRMSISLDDLTQTEALLFKHMDRLSQTDKDMLKKNGMDITLLKIFQALNSANKNIQDFTLYRFQFDAIQEFLAKILVNDKTPFIIGAPTDSGKSLVFYVCSVLKMAIEKLNGTSTFITLPTRALNTTQFQEMSKFFYHLNKQEIKITLGLFMGSGSERESNRTITRPDTIQNGDEIVDIEICPKCGSDEIVAHKPNTERVIPMCKSCNEKLDFVYLSTTEVQRFCPNVVIGTPDFIAGSLSTFSGSHSIFGAPCKLCPQCGKYTLLNRSDQNNTTHICEIERYGKANGGCGATLDDTTRTQSNPSFVVFDEIHTMSGTQGNLFGQFLSLLSVVKERYGLDKDISYLGATATIANEEDLVKNLTGNQTGPFVFPSRADYDSYFIQSNDDVRHRFVAVEPQLSTTRYSAETMGIFGFDGIKQVIGQRADLEEAYKMQTIYVKRKIDGSAIENSMPSRAWRIVNDSPWVKFAHGDFSRSDIAKIVKAVKANEYDVLLVTSIFGQGVDFPNLNILHFFGVPNSFIELSQVFGRTGRGKYPSIIFLHIQNNIPRDQFFYYNTPQILGKLNEWYEPMPINVMNPYAIDLSLINMVLGLMITRQSGNSQTMYCDGAFNSINSQQSLQEFADDLEKIYRKPWVTDADWKKIAPSIIRKAYDNLIRVKDTKQPNGYSEYLSKAFSGRAGGPRLTINSLRDTGTRIFYNDKDYRDANKKFVDVSELIDSLTSGNGGGNT